MKASFSIADRIYGSTFFLATGFNGLYVLIRTIFLTIYILRHVKFYFSPQYHFGFETSTWY